MRKAIAPRDDPGPGTTPALLARYAAFLVRRPGLVLALAVVVTAAITSGVRHLVIDLDPEKGLPANDPYVLVDRRIQSEFGGRNFVAIAVVPAVGMVWQRSVLDAVQGITLALLDAPGVIRQNVLSLASPYVRIPRDRDGVLVVDYLMRDVPAEPDVPALRDTYLAEPMFRGTLVSDDQRAALVLADFYEGTTATQIVAALESATAPFRSPATEIAMTGEPVYHWFENRVLDQQRWYLLATIAGLAGVLYLAFGHLQGVVLPIATAALACAWAMGFMGFAGFPLTAWTTAVPVIVLTIATGHSAQMLTRYYDDHRRLRAQREAVRVSLCSIGPVMLTAGATAAASFATLAALGIPALAHFGLSVAAGIAAAVVLELTFMAALRTIWPLRTAAPGDGLLAASMAPALRAIEWLARRPRLTIALLAGVVLAATAGLGRLRTDTDMSAYWATDTQYARDLRLFARYFPSTTTLNLLVEGPPGSMQTPEAMRLMAGLQGAMAADPEVGRTSSVADLIRRTHEIFAPDDAAAGMPDTPALVAQLFYLASSPAMERYVDRSYSRAVVSGFLNKDDSAVVRRVIDRIRTYVRDHAPPALHVAVAGGSGPILLALNDHTVRGKVLNVVVVFGVIFLLATILLRSPLGGVYVILPLALVLLVNLGMFAWTGIPFDLAGASVAAISVGIGADYAIYFLYRFREESRAGLPPDEALHAAVHGAGRGIFFVALAIASGFLVYAVSGYLPLRLCGIVIPSTMVLSSVFTLSLVGTLVVVRSPAFVDGGRRPDR